MYNKTIDSIIHNEQTSVVVVFIYIYTTRQVCAYY